VPPTLRARADEVIDISVKILTSRLGVLIAFASLGSPDNITDAETTGKLDV